MSWLSKITGGGKTSGAVGDTKSAGMASLADAKIRIGSKDFSVVELGVRTFRIYPYEGDLIKRQNFGFQAILNVDGELIEFPGFGLVLEISGSMGLSAKFKAPQPFYDRKLIDFLARLRSQAPGTVKAGPARPGERQHTG